MTYKSVFTVLSDIEFAQAPLEQASHFAHSQNAHLDVLCLGVDRTQMGHYFSGASAVVVDTTLNDARAEALDIERMATAFLKNFDGRWGTEAGVCLMTDVARHVAARARFSDLTILPKPYGEGKGVEMETIVEAALFDGAAPVLVVPGENEPLSQPKVVTLAWNESQESLNAAKAALPLLQSANIVRVLVIDPAKHGANRSDPGGLLSTFLARHGIRVEIDVLSKSLPRVSDVILRHAKDKKSDLIVMGAYGHSRLRESILGGATRHMLEQADVPVFMAH